MKHLMEALGNVQLALPIIHIAGTNGKGSVGAYLSSLYRRMGLTVGRYTSPAVFSSMEVFTLNDIPMSADEYETLMEQIRCVCRELPEAQWPTIFEAETAIAFLWFAKKKPDIILMECGMGGAEDATNVLDTPIASVITSISLDHIRFLGNTCEEIASVKAGIIKSHCPVFSAPQTEGVKSVLSKYADEKDAEITFVDTHDIRLESEKPGQLCFSWKQITFETKMAGHYQLNNCALALETFLGTIDRIAPDCLAKDAAYTAKLQEAIANTSWPGRFEVISEKPLVILDGAHNEGAALELAESLRHSFGQSKIVMVMGVLSDKAHAKMLSILLPFASELITLTPPDNPRAFSGMELYQEAKQLNHQMSIRVADSVMEAIQMALEQNQPILFCGSLSYLGAVRKEWNNGIKSRINK